MAASETPENWLDFTTAAALAHGACCNYRHARCLMAKRDCELDERHESGLNWPSPMAQLGKQYQRHEWSGKGRCTWLEGLLRAAPPAVLLDYENRVSLPPKHPLRKLIRQATIGAGVRVCPDCGTTPLAKRQRLCGDCREKRRREAYRRAKRKGQDTD